MSGGVEVEDEGRSGVKVESKWTQKRGIHRAR